MNDIWPAELAIYILYANSAETAVDQGVTLVSQSDPTSY